MMVLYKFINTKNGYLFSKLRTSLIGDMVMKKTVQSSFSTATKSLAVYHSGFVDPNPDPAYYQDNPPDKNDKMSQTLIKAAPTDHTYSIFYDEKVKAFEKYMMKKGRSAISRRIMRGALQHVKSVQVKKYHQASEQEKPNIEVNPLTIFYEALENAKPLLSVETVQKGARSYQVPTVITPKKQLFLVSRAVRKHVWNGHPNTNAAIRLGNEILAAYRNEGASVKAKQALHKTAYANRAYANM